MQYTPDGTPLDALADMNVQHTPGGVILHSPGERLAVTGINAVPARSPELLPIPQIDLDYIRANPPERIAARCRTDRPFLDKVIQAAKWVPVALKYIETVRGAVK